MSPTFSVGDRIVERFTLSEAIPTPDRQWPRWAAVDAVSGDWVMLTTIDRDAALEQQFRDISTRLKMLSHPHINPHLDFCADASSLFIVDALPDRSNWGSKTRPSNALQLEPQPLLDVLEFSEALGFSVTNFDTDWIWIDQNGEPILLLLGWPDTAILRERIPAGSALKGPAGFGSWFYQHCTGDASEDARSIEEHPSLAPESKRLVALARLNRDDSFSSLTRGYQLQETLTEGGTGVSALEAKPFDKINPQRVFEIPAESRVGEPESSPDSSHIRLLVGGLLVIVAGFVFFVLPGLVTQPEVEPLTELNTPLQATTPNALSPSPLSVAKDKLAREEALTLAEALLRKIIRLEDLGMRLWDPEQLMQINEAAVAADEAYRAESHQTAVASYQTLIERLEIVEAELPNLRVRYRAMAESALEDVNETETLKFWEILAALSPEDADIQARWRQVQSLPQISAMMIEAEQLVQAGQSTSAIKLLTEASELFPEWTPPETRRRKIQLELDTIAFRASMSAGFARLNEENFDAARRAFKTAARLAPNRDSPEEGLEQVRQAQLKSETSTRSRNAATAESAGQWAEALKIYKELLSLNPALTTLQDRIAVVERRIALSEQLDALIEDPSQLQSYERLKEAKALVIEISQLAPPIGDLKAKLRPLTRDIMSARRPVTLNLSSDGLTNATVLKVGPEGVLGLFTETSLQLIPGRYVITGSRKGYVDVRHNIELKPDAPEITLRVACEEKIP